jgi:predicted enzyme related to lactoylglutathione lyase
MTFQALLRERFAARRARNARLSLRGFARSLAIDHSTLSQILRGKRRMSAPMVRALGRRLQVGNPVVRWQIVAKDPDTVARFYSSVFGWKVRTDNALGYRTFDAGTDKGISGGVWPSPPEGHNLVQLFIEVADIDAHIAKALAHGATIIVPKSELPAFSTTSSDPTLGSPVRVTRNALTILPALSSARGCTRDSVTVGSRADDPEFLTSPGRPG